MIIHKFVELAPEELEPGVLYISIPYTTAVHKCFCGCGFEVVTPLSPSDWRLIFDGKTVSLEPSIGNWGFECQSHYWITRNQVRWAEKWSVRRIEAAQRARSGKGDESGMTEETIMLQKSQLDSALPIPRKEGVWRKLKKTLKGSRNKGEEG